MLRLTSVTSADGEVVWSWRPDAGAKLLNEVTVARKPGHRGEHEGNRNTIAQGKPELLRLNLWSYPRAFCCTGPMGATGTRLSLRPPFDERAEGDAKLGQCMPRERGFTSPPLFEI